MCTNEKYWHLSERLYTKSWNSSVRVSRLPFPWWHLHCLDQRLVIKRISLLHEKYPCIVSEFHDRVREKSRHTVCISMRWNNFDNRVTESYDFTLVAGHRHILSCSGKVELFEEKVSCVYAHQSLLKSRSLIANSDEAEEWLDSHNTSTQASWYIVNSRCSSQRACARSEDDAVHVDIQLCLYRVILWRLCQYPRGWISASWISGRASVEASSWRIQWDSASDECWA